MPTKKQKELKNKNFFTRTKSAIFVASFYVLYALLLIFSNEHWFPVLLSLKPEVMGNVQFTLNFFNILMVIPIIYFVAKEITDLCFPGKKIVFIYTVCAIFVLTMGISIYLIGVKYGLIPSPKSLGINAFTIFLMAALCGIVFFTLVSTLVWIFMSRHIVYVGKKTRVWYPLLVFILNTFFVGFVYTTIFHTWTTFIFLIILSSGCDVFAYIGGSLFGKHKMSPTISPNKTWEGALFGVGITLLLYCAVLGLFYIPGAEAQGHSLYCYLGCQWATINPEIKSSWLNITQPYYWGIYIAMGLCFIVVSIFGDLLFSYIKRRFNVKDFSNLIPGHGGILDRIDSLILVFTFYFLFTVIAQLICFAIPNIQTGLPYLWGIPTNFVF